MDVSIWYSANGLATILGSLLTYGLGHADTALYSYQLIFVVCGSMSVYPIISPPYLAAFHVPSHRSPLWRNGREEYDALIKIRAVALSIPTWFLFPAHPTKARFLSDDQKYMALERIRLNNTGTQNTRQSKACIGKETRWYSVGGWLTAGLRFQEGAND